MIYNKLCLDRQCIKLWTLPHKSLTQKEGIHKIRKKANYRWREAQAKLRRAIIKQFFVCKGKDLDRVPRAQCMPLTEIERIFESITEKNGEVEHDRAVDAFDWQEYRFECYYWHDAENVYQSLPILLPKNTVITQAKD